MTFRTLDLNLLKVFEALMSEGSVTRAARALFMTQPAVSNALARLREALGDPLFVRSGAGVVPTQRAVTLWAPLGESLERMRGALDEESFEAHRARSEFRLSMSDYVAGLVMPRLVDRFSRSAPLARLHTAPNTVIEAQYPAQIRALSLWTVEYACFVRRGHPLGRLKRMNARRFLAAKHVDVSLAGGTSPSYDLFLASQGLSRNLVVTVNHYAVAYEIVRQSDLIGVLPRDLAAQSQHAASLDVLPLPLSAPPRIVSLFWHQRNDTQPAQRWLRETLVEMLKA
jgi:DNA-binding transcriptional LysR family regulator